MSYTPRIIASWSDLNTPENLQLINDWHDVETDEGWVMNEIEKAVSTEDFLTLKRIKITVFVAEFSRKNEIFRNTLDEMEVEYVLDN